MYNSSLHIRRKQESVTEIQVHKLQDLDICLGRDVSLGLIICGNEICHSPASRLCLPVLLYAIHSLVAQGQLGWP